MFTNQQCLEIIKNYYRNSESVVAILRALIPIFGRNNSPTQQAVRAVVDKFKTKFTLLDVPVPKRRIIARSEEIIAAVSASIQNEPNQSIPCRSRELVIGQTRLWRITRKDLGLHAFKIKLTQELKPLDHLKRRNFLVLFYLKDRNRLKLMGFLSLYFQQECLPYMEGPILVS